MTNSSSSFLLAPYPSINYKLIFVVWKLSAKQKMSYRSCAQSTWYLAFRPRVVPLSLCPPCVTYPVCERFFFFSFFAANLRLWAAKPRSRSWRERKKKLFLSRQDLDRGFAAHNRSFATEKKKTPLVPRVCVTRKKTARKKWPREFLRARSTRASRPQDISVTYFFSRN